MVGLFKAAWTYQAILLEGNVMLTIKYAADCMLLCKMYGNPKAMPFVRARCWPFSYSVQSVIMAQFSSFGQSDPDLIKQI